MKSIRTESEVTVIILSYSDGSGEPMALCGYGSDEEAQKMVQYIKASEPSKNITTARIPIIFCETITEVEE